MNEPEIAVSAAQIAAEALFCSAVQPSRRPSHEQIRTAVAEHIRGRNAEHRCLQQVAFAYGQDPLLAAARMKWCRAAIAEVYGTDGEEARG